MENKLRPTNEMGWNHNAGGIKPCGRKTVPSTEEVTSSAAKRKVTVMNMSQEVKASWRLARSDAMKSSPKAQAQAAKLKILNTGKVHTEEHRMKVSAALTGRVFSDDHKRNMTASKLGTSHSEQTRLKISASKLANKQAPWQHPMANLSVWANSEIIYEEYVKNFKCGHKKLGRIMGYGLGLNSIVKEFDAGWLPSEDEVFETWLSQHKQQEAYLAA